MKRTSTQSSPAKRQKLDILSPERSFNYLAWVLERNSSSCTAVAMIKGKLLIADNDQHHGSRLPSKIDDFQKRTLNYLAKAVIFSDADEYKANKDAFLKNYLIEKSTAILRGGLITTLTSAEQEQLVDSFLKNPDTSHNKIRHSANITHSSDKIAHLIEFWKKTCRRLGVLEDFLKQNPHSPLYASLQTAASDNNSQIHYLRLADDGAAKGEDRKWLLADEAPGCGIILSNSKGVHAELKIIDFLLATRLVTSTILSIAPLNVGISKKCCVDCENVIDIINEICRDKFDIEKVFLRTARHKLSFSNWAKCLPNFLLIPSSKTLVAKGLLTAENKKAVGYKERAKFKSELFSHLDEIDNSETIIWTYRDYELLRLIRIRFEQLPAHSNEKGDHSPMSHSSPEKQAPAAISIFSAKKKLENIPTPIILEVLESRMPMQDMPQGMIIKEERENISLKRSTDEASSTRNALVRFNANYFYINFLFRNIEGITRQVQGNLRGKIIKFDVFKTLGDGRCGYYSLPIPYDREGIVQLLLQHKTNENIRIPVAAEIYETLLAGELPSILSNEFPQFNNFLDYLAESDQEQAALLSEVISAIDPEDTKVHNHQIDNIILYLENISDPKDYESNCLARLRSFQQVHEAIFDKFMLFCQSIEVFEAFISHHIAKDGKLSFSQGGLSFNREGSVLDAVLLLMQPPIKLYIWESIITTDKNLSRVAIVYEGGPEHGIPTHIYHAPGVDSHYELMAEADGPGIRAKSTQQVRRKLFWEKIPPASSNDFPNDPDNDPAKDDPPMPKLV